MEVISYNTFLQNKKNTSQIDINTPAYLYKFIDEILKKELNELKQGKFKPFKLSLNRNLVIIQFPNQNYDSTLYDKWYNKIEQTLNKIFYRKESENDVIPDTFQRSRLFTNINDKEYEINGNIVIKSMPIYQPTSKKSKLTTSNENKHAIKHKGQENEEEDDKQYIDSSDEE